MECRTAQRQWLAAAIAGAAPTWSFGGDTTVDTFMRVIRHEGVVGLLHAQLSGASPPLALPEALRTTVANAARAQAALSLYQQHRCRQILARLAQAQLPALVLKGSALAHWAYPAPHLRERGDIDLLLRSRADTDRVVDVLGAMGCTVREAALPGDLVCFEVTCVQNAGRANALEIDLHWHLSSTPAFAFRFGWDELEASHIALPGLAPNARALAPVHAYLHACMHRMQNRSLGLTDTLKWLYDLVAIGRLFAPGDWKQLEHSAIARGLAGTCLDGMRAAAAFWDTSMPLATQTALQNAARRESMDPGRMDRWWYVQRMSMAAYPTLAQKLRWLRQRLIPDRAYLYARYGQSGLAKALSTRFAALLRRWRS